MYIHMYDDVWVHNNSHQKGLCIGYQSHMTKSHATHANDYPISLHFGLAFQKQEHEKQKLGGIARGSWQRNLYTYIHIRIYMYIHIYDNVWVRNNLHQKGLCMSYQSHMTKSHATHANERPWATKTTGCAATDPCST